MDRENSVTLLSGSLFPMSPIDPTGNKWHYDIETCSDNTSQITQLPQVTQVTTQEKPDPKGLPFQNTKMERPSRPRRKDRSEKRGGFAGVDREGIAAYRAASTSLSVFGLAATLFENCESSIYCAREAHMVPHPGFPAVTMDRFDARLLLDKAQMGPGFASAPDEQFDETDCDERVLDEERYRDLEGTAGHEDEGGLEARSRGAAIPYTYPESDFGQQEKVSGSSWTASENMFAPDFPVPEYLHNALPKTEKCHKLIAETARFVRDAGGQVEVVLRVKQGNNPNFSFLLPDDRVFPYYRWLVEEGQPAEEKTSSSPHLPSSNHTVPLHEEQHQESRDMADSTTQMSALDDLQSYDSCGALDDPITYACQDNLIGNDPSPQTAINNASKGVPSCDGVLDSSRAQYSENRGDMPNEDQEDKSGAQDWMPEPIPSEMESEGNQGGKGSPEPGVPGVDDTHIIESGSNGLGVETRAIMEKLVAFIQRNGPRFERVVRKRESMNPKFGFMLPWHPHHSIYRQCLVEAIGASSADEIFRFWEKGEPKIQKENPLYPLTSTGPGVSAAQQSDASKMSSQVFHSATTQDPGFTNCEAPVMNVEVAKEPSECGVNIRSPDPDMEDANQPPLIKSNPSIASRQVAQSGSPDSRRGLYPHRIATNLHLDDYERHKHEVTKRPVRDNMPRLPETTKSQKKVFIAKYKNEDTLSPAPSQVECRTDPSVEDKKAQRRLKAKMLLDRANAKRMEVEVAHRSQRARAVLNHRQAFLTDFNDMNEQLGEPNDVSKTIPTQTGGSYPVADLPALTEVFTSATKHAKKHQEAFVATLRDPNQVLTTEQDSLCSIQGMSEVDEDTSELSSAVKNPKEAKKKSRESSRKHMRHSSGRDKHKKHHKKEKRGHKRRRSASLSFSEMGYSTSIQEKPDEIVVRDLKSKMKQMLDKV